MPATHGPVINFRLPLHDHRDLLKLCGELSPGVYVKQLVLEALHGDSAEPVSPWAGLARNEEARKGPGAIRKEGPLKGWPVASVDTSKDESGDSTGSREVGK